MRSAGARRKRLGAAHNAVVVLGQRQRQRLAGTTATRVASVGEDNAASGPVRDGPRDAHPGSSGVGVSGRVGTGHVGAGRVGAGRVLRRWSGGVFGARQDDSRTVTGKEKRVVNRTSFIINKIELR